MPLGGRQSTGHAIGRDTLSSMIGPQVGSAHDHSPLGQHLAVTVRQSMAPTSLYRNQYPPVSAYLRVQDRPLASVFEVPSPPWCHTRYSWHDNHNSVFSVHRLFTAALKCPRPNQAYFEPYINFGLPKKTSNAIMAAQTEHRPVNRSAGKTKCRHGHRHGERNRRPPSLSARDVHGDSL